MNYGYSCKVMWGYTGETYTYYFDLDGDGEYDDNISSDGFINLPVLQKGGYSLVGWYEKPDFSSGELVPGTSYYSSSNRVLYAKWLPDKIGSEYGSSFDTAIAVGTGSYNVRIDEPGEVVYFMFTASENGTIIISSEVYNNEACDTYCSFYTAKNFYDCYDDDSAGNRQFLLACGVEAGRTYYIAVKLYDAANTGSFILNITY